MPASQRQAERHQALSDARREHSRKAADLEQQLVSLIRREDRLPVLRDLRFAESEMARLAVELARLERATGDESDSSRTVESLLKHSPPVFAPLASWSGAIAPLPPRLKGNLDLVDLYIRVELERRKGKTALVYRLRSPLEELELSEREIPGPVLDLDPEGFRSQLIRKIEDLSKGIGAQGETVSEKDAEKDLANLGRNLYRRLFSDQMRSTYLEVREQVRTVRITSDEPWIPWELVRPFEKAGFKGEPIDDDFLCAQFQLTRWLASSKPPPETIEVHTLACVEAGMADRMPPLPNAKKELELLAGLAASHPGVVNDSLPDATYEQVQALFQKGGLQLLHIVAHGDFTAKRTEEARIVLCGERSLSVGDLEGPLLLAFANARPFVFFNACRVGQQGWALAGLGGWAEAWIRRAGAGGFLAPQWSVRDGLALPFVESFYGALKAGHPLGGAITEARRRVRALSPANPTWLAYALYANQGGRLVWPGESS